MSVRRQLLAEQWDTFARAVLPSCSPIHRQELRRAFYAGAQAMLNGIIGALSTEGDVTEEDLQTMAEVQGELTDFCERVKRGLA